MAGLTYDPNTFATINPNAPQPTPTPQPGPTLTPNNPGTGGALKFNFGGTTTPDNTPNIGRDPNGDYRWFTVGPDGKERWAALAPPVNMNPGHTSSDNTSNTTTNSTSSSTNDIGPNALANDAANRKAQSDLEAMKILAQLPLQQAQIAQLQDSIVQAEAQRKIAQGNLDYLLKKGAFEESIGRAADARATSDQAFNQQNGIATLQSSIVGMQMQHASAQAQLEQNVALANAAASNNAAQFNATQEFNVQQANDQSAIQKQGQLQSLGSNISQAAKDPGDRGALASLILANSGWGQQDQAIAGTDLRTNDSLMPLQSLLNLRADVMQRPDHPYSFNPITPTMAQAPTIPGPDFSGIKIPSLNLTPGAAQFATPPAASGGGGGGGATAGGPATGDNSPGVLGVPAGGTLGVVNGQAVWAPTGMNQAANGGMQGGAYISGEAGPEINIPMPGGKAMVINAKQALKLGIDLSGVKKMADGGIFNSTNSIFGDMGGGDVSGAQAFLDESSMRARSGTPWAGNSSLPTPVYASSPGTDPVITQLLAGLSAQAKGTPPDYFARQAAALTPAGLNQAVIRRS